MTGQATPLKILDGHMHLLTAETAREAEAWQPPMSPEVAVIPPGCGGDLIKVPRRADGPVDPVAGREAAGLT